MEITIQKRIKAQRILHGYTQKEIAQKLNWSIVRYNHIEMGKAELTNLRYFELVKLSEVLDIPLEDLVK